MGEKWVQVKFVRKVPGFPYAYALGDIFNSGARLAPEEEKRQ